MRKAVAKLAYLLGITMILNSVQPVISGIQRCIHQNLILIINSSMVFKSFLKLWDLEFEKLGNIRCRCCCGRRVASFGSLYKLVLLLLSWTPSWFSSWIQNKFTCTGTAFKTWEIYSDNHQIQNILKHCRSNDYELPQGIWMGMIFGTFLQTLILVYIICKTNWNKEVSSIVSLVIYRERDKYLAWFADLIIKIWIISGWRGIWTNENVGCTRWFTQLM